MPGRRTKNSKSIIENSSNDITNSGITPLATSSPRLTETFSRSIASEKDLQALCQTFISHLENEKNTFEKVFAAKLSASEALLKPLVGKESLQKKATAKILKDFRKSINPEDTTDGNSGSNGKRTLQKRTTLRSRGENPFETSAKKAKTTTIKEDNDTDPAGFKKPTGRALRNKNSDFGSIGYKTPNVSGRTHGRYNIAMVTPGPDCNKPINVLRQPRPGELAISITGSPLLVTAMPSIPSISIPLANGKVVTVLADENLDPDMSIFAEIGSPLKKCLSRLEKVLPRRSGRKRTIQ